MSKDAVANETGIKLVPNGNTYADLEMSNTANALNQDISEIFLILFKSKFSIFCLRFPEFFI